MFGESFHLSDDCFPVTLAGIDLTLGQGESFALPVNRLQAVQYTDRLIIVLYLLIELEQQLQHILAILVTGVDAFDHRDRTGIILLADIGLRQGLHIDFVIRIEGSSTLHAFDRLLRILQERVILPEEEIHLRGIRIQFLTMAQQVEGCIVVALLPLDHRLQKELVIGL